MSLAYSDLTVVKHNGVLTSLGYPINNDYMLQPNNLKFNGGGKSNKNKSPKVKGEKKQTTNNTHEDLGIPVGLFCKTQTVCQSENNDSYNDSETIPDSLFDKLLELAEITKPKNMSKRQRVIKNTNKTKKYRSKK